MKLHKMLAVTLVGAFSLAGCSTAGSDGSGANDGSSSSASGSKAITVWLDDNVINPCFAEVVTSTWANDDVDVQIELKPDWDSLTKTAVAGGAGPDVIMTPGVAYTAEFAEAGALVPLDAYRAEFGWGEFFAPWALSLGEKDGTLYSLQGELETMLIWYNKTLFEEQGITPPTTIAELDAVADQFSALGIQPFASGNTDWQGVNEWLISGIFNGHAGGSAVHSALAGQGSFTDQPFVEATDLLDKWMKAGYISGGLDRYYVTTIDEYLAQLANGSAAMNIEGSWRFENIDEFFTEAGTEWDWIPFPSPDGSPQFSIGTGSSWAINANSDNPDDGAAVLGHIFSPQVQAQLAVDCGFALGPVAVDPADLEGLDPRQSRLYVALADAAASGEYGYLTWSFWGPKSNTYLIQEIEKVWGGSMTSEEYLQGLNDLYLEELEAGITPPLPAR